MSRVTIYSLDLLLSNFEPVSCSMSASNCCFLTCIHVSQVVVLYFNIFKKFPQFVVIHTGLSMANETEADVFLEFSCFFYDPVDVGNLISGSSACSKPSLYICKFLVHIFLKTSLKDFEHYFASMWNECNCTVVWIFFGTAFLWDWNENWPFLVLWPLLSFPNLLAYECSTFIVSSFRFWNSSAEILSPPLALFVVANFQCCKGTGFFLLT